MDVPGSFTALYLLWVLRPSNLWVFHRALPMFDAQYLLFMVHESMKFVFF